MPMRPKEPLTDLDRCIMREMIIRRGLVYREDIQPIANICRATLVEVTEIVNAYTESGKEVNRLVDKAVSDVPLASTNRQLVYAQAMFEDQIRRRQEAGLPITNADPLEILDFARKTVAPTLVNVNVQQNNVLEQPQIFNLEGMDIQQVEALVGKLQRAIDSGEIIDADFTELGSAQPALTGRTSVADAEASGEVFSETED